MKAMPMIMGIGTERINIRANKNYNIYFNTRHKLPAFILLKETFNY